MKAFSAPTWKDSRLPTQANHTNTIFGIEDKEIMSIHLIIVFKVPKIKFILSHYLQTYHSAMWFITLKIYKFPKEIIRQIMVIHAIKYYFY